MLNIACPKCKEYLQQNGSEFSCPSCSITYRLTDGVIDTREGGEPYWCEVPQDRMGRLIDDIKTENWESALKKLCKERKDDGLYHRTVDTDRANWFYFIPLERDSVVLDAGSGWGAVTFSLAQHYKHVVSLDSVFERIKFIDMRKEQDHIDNIQCICGNALKLPFKDATFDLVVLNGVLEWVGLSDLSVSPYQVQVNVLKEINRVLKPGGFIYIGIENRFGVDYFIGYRDHHSGLKYSTLMPRFMADIYSRIVKGSGYRTYTHSFGGYKRLLGKSGYTNHRILFPVSNYRKFYYLTPLDNDNALEFLFKYIIPEKLIFVSSFVKKIYFLVLAAFYFGLTPLLKYFVTSYSIISEKK